MTNRAKYRYQPSAIKAREKKRQKRQAISRGGIFVEVVDKEEVYRSDGYICQICLLAVDLEAKPGSRMAASLDHITPLSSGGRHERSIVRTAHQVCNSRRGGILGAGRSSW